MYPQDPTQDAGLGDKGRPGSMTPEQNRAVQEILRKAVAEIQSTLGNDHEVRLEKVTEDPAGLPIGVDVEITHLGAGGRKSANPTREALRELLERATEGGTPTLYEEVGRAVAAGRTTSGHLDELVSEAVRGVANPRLYLADFAHTVTLPVLVDALPRIMRSAYNSLEMTLETLAMVVRFGLPVVTHEDGTITFTVKGKEVSDKQAGLIPVLSILAIRNRGDEENTEYDFQLRFIDVVDAIKGSPGPGGKSVEDILAGMGIHFSKREGE